MACDPQVTARNDRSRPQPIGPTPNFTFGAKDGAAPGAASPADDKTCAAQAFEAERLPLDFYLLVDGTGSMGLTVAGASTTRWALVRDALIEFVMDAKTAGMGAGLHFFPLLPPRCQMDSECAGIHSERCVLYGSTESSRRCQKDFCAPDEYATPTVAISELPGNADRLAATLGGWTIGGGNNDAAALEGTFAHLQKHAAANPGRRAALVFVGDGFPANDACKANSVDATVAQITKGRATRPFIATYAIGVTGPQDVDYTRVKQVFTSYAAAGGTGTPFIVETRADLRTKFVEALHRIRDLALPCEFPIPASATGAVLNFDRVNLSLTTPEGQTSIIGNVADAASCHPMRGGWYYDVSPATGVTPRTLVACPATCERLNRGLAGRVAIRVGCKTVPIE